MSSELRVDKIIPTDGVPTDGGGGVVQVVGKTYTSSSNIMTTSTSFTVLSDFNTSITPHFSSSKIFVLFSFPAYATNSYSGGIADYTIGRGGSVINNFSYGSLYQNASGSHYSPFTMHIVDSPSTTSAVTYNLMCKTNSSSNSIGVGAYGSNEVISVTLMEVSA